MSGPEQDSLRQRWEEYQGLDRLREHWWWRPGWRPGRRMYTWHVTFDGQAALHDLVCRIQGDLAGLPGLDMVPLEGLHLTTQGLGFVDEVDRADVDAIAREAARRCTGLEPFDLTLGPVDPDAEGIGVLVLPWDPVQRLRGMLREAIGAVWSQVPEAADGFRPHVTVAYSGADVPPDKIRTRLATLRELPPAPVGVDHVQLIELSRDERVYRWDVVETVRLGIG